MDEYYYPADTEYSGDRFGYLRVFAGPGASGYYYFSPKLRLSFEGNIYYNFYNTDNTALILPPYGLPLNYFRYNKVNT